MLKQKAWTIPILKTIYEWLQDWKEEFTNAFFINQKSNICISDNTLGFNKNIAHDAVNHGFFAPRNDVSQLQRKDFDSCVLVFILHHNVAVTKAE